MGLLASAPFLRPAFAQDGTVHEVQMLNVDPDNRRNRMVFKPRVQVVQPGDTVRFLSVDRGHNSVSKEGMIPEGAEGWRSQLNEDFDVTLTEPGFYGYYCQPHETTGMVGLIVVEGEGMMDNYEAAQEVRQRGRAADVWEEIWAEVEEMGLTA